MGVFIFYCYLDFQGQAHFSSAVNDGRLSQTTNQTNNQQEARYEINNQIRSIFQDSRGNYWFGTNGAGVYRYDHITLTQFTTQDGLADDRVIRIQEDEWGHIWFESAGFEISQFDGISFNSLTDQVQITDGTDTEWSAEEGDAWFAAGGGVLRYRSGSLAYLPLDTAESLLVVFESR